MAHLPLDPAQEAISNKIRFGRVGADIHSNHKARLEYPALSYPAKDMAQPGRPADPQRDINR